jgi:hypothetical protein
VKEAMARELAGGVWRGGSPNPIRGGEGRWGGEGGGGAQRRRRGDKRGRRR